MNYYITWNYSADINLFQRLKSNTDILILQFKMNHYLYNLLFKSDNYHVCMKFIAIEFSLLFWQNTHIYPISHLSPMSMFILISAILRKVITLVYNYYISIVVLDSEIYLDWTNLIYNFHNLSILYKFRVSWIMPVFLKSNMMFG